MITLVFQSWFFSSIFNLHFPGYFWTLFFDPVFDPKKDPLFYPSGMADVPPILTLKDPPVFDPLFTLILRLCQNARAMSVSRAGRGSSAQFQPHLFYLR